MTYALIPASVEFLLLLRLVKHGQLVVCHLVPNEMPNRALEGLTNPHDVVEDKHDTLPGSSLPSIKAKLPVVLTSYGRPPTRYPPMGPKQAANVTKLNHLAMSSSNFQLQTHTLP